METEAKRLVNSLMWWVNNSTSGADVTMQEAACELLRLSDENRKLREQRDQLMREHSTVDNRSVLGDN